MGLRYILYRLWHELEKRLGVLIKRHPINPLEKSFVSLEEWKNLNIQYAISERELIQIPILPSESLREKAERILNGEICFFSSEWKNLGKEYNWITNPETNYQYDPKKHWSKIRDFDPVQGDIKYVWEKSRFTYLLTVIRSDYHFNEDNSEFVFSEIESWINANQVNAGPNWKCSQEIALRLFNWSYALNFYKNSKALTEGRWSKIQNVIYWSLHHIYKHINFSRIAVRNNHAITETMILAISETMFPYIPESKKWSDKGRKWLEREVAYQVYEDGTFLQFSMNYHRVLIQLFSLGISLTEKKGRPFSKLFYDRAMKSVNFLYQCIQLENGYLPNYGANDGALFFPLAESDYRDFRPQLNSLHRILTGEELFEGSETNEDYYWLSPNLKEQYFFDRAKLNYGLSSFDLGGYYICRTPSSFTFIKCGGYEDRPSHADNLHIDIWVNGKNILRDSGTYKYNSGDWFANYFSSTAAHNTVVVNDESQMLKGSRFIWYYWSQRLSAKWTESDDFYIFNGVITAFRNLSSNATHERQIKISKNEASWLIKDKIQNLNAFSKKQVWHCDDSPLQFQNDNQIEVSKIDSYYSNYYGQKVNGFALVFSFQEELETKIYFKQD
jgi:hypothetical protein